jgi:low temperature requirement protein LtrA
VQIAGVLILAAGVPRAFDERDFAVVVLGYAVMRLSLVAQWLRAARASPEGGGRRTTLRYAAGISACMVGWIGMLALPAGWRLVAWLALAAAELVVPIWAERTRPIPWHPPHIAERFGLVTLIVLGESILAASTALQSAFDEGGTSAGLLTLAAGGLLVVFALWWLYFDQPAHQVLSTSSRGSFTWGYGHLLIFASAGAVGAGLQTAVDQTTGHAHLPSWGGGAAVAVPVALYLVCVWLLHARPHHRGAAYSATFPLAAALVLAASAASHAVLVIGLVLAALVAATAVLADRRRAGAAGHPR